MFTRRPGSQSEESLSSVADADTPNSRKMQRRPDARLGAVPEADIGHFQSPQPSSLEQRMATIPYFQALSPGSLPYSMPNGADWPMQRAVSNAQQGSGSEPKMIGIWKDGEMHWIREDIVSALTMGTPQQMSSGYPSVQSPPLSPESQNRPNMRINIPIGQHNNSVMPYRPASPAGSLSSVYTQLPIQSPKGQEPSLSYPTETSDMVDQITPGDSPTTTKSGSNTGSGWSDEQYSPVTQYSSNSSVSNNEASPKIAINRNYSVRNPAAAGVFEKYNQAAASPTSQMVPKTPTLDQAEHDLRQQLSGVSAASVEDTSAPLASVPALPTRSRKRESFMDTHPARRTSIRQTSTTKPESVYKVQSAKRDTVLPEVQPQPQKKRGMRISKAFTFRKKRAVPVAEPKVSLQISGPITLQEPTQTQIIKPRASTTIERHVDEAKISADAAESVIYHIFESVNGFNDLFAFARINKGFFSVFKRNELVLIKSVHRNFCAAGWELRQASPSEIITSGSARKQDYTPARYMQFIQRDSIILTSLKSVIHTRCQPFLRLETVEALREKDTARSEQLDNALRRIWTFCYLFGGNSGREHDLEGQMDWLRGGQSARSSPANANTSFGLGNLGGLSAEELYDITELWNCIKAIVSGVQCPGAIAQARLVGIFKGKHIKKGDADSQESLLEEWLNHLVTLGLTTILDIANATDDATPNSFFSTASDMGWNKWTAPSAGLSRASFLRDAVSHVYEEKIASFRPAPSTEAKEEAKERTARFAAELKEMKRTATGSTTDKQPRLSSWLNWIEGVDSVSAEDAAGRGRASSRAGDAPSSPRTSSQPTSLFSSRFGKKPAAENKRSHSSHPSADTTSSAMTASSAGAHSTNASSDDGSKSPALSACTSVYSTRPNSPVLLAQKTTTQVTPAPFEA
ncbi:MAG: hypothetical protein M1828_002633 [Chrysothrix sp. TS-e1954]|nr:MAG: hypothetical protein M1828_002633 [Chrysothrix sp. TS-e1954]